MARTSRRHLDTGTRRPNRRTRATLGETFRQANERAHQQVNRRLGQRNDRTSIHAAIAAVHDDIPVPRLGQRVLRWLLGLSLVPLASLTTATFFQGINLAAQNERFFTGIPFFFFTLGFVLMAMAFLVRTTRAFWLYLYVLGHELTHALFIVLCLGRVSGFKVGLDGGHVLTNKTNLLIALSPYFVPFWSLLFLLTFWVVGLFTHLPYAEQILYCGVGLSWGFHILWTLWMIPRDQPDLRENGTFLSLVIIYLVNLILLASFLCLASEDLTGLGFLADWANRGYQWIHTGLRWTAELANTLNPPA